MATPATEDLRELERLLVLSADHGETMTEAALRDELGCGHDDLHAMLDVLREHGKAVEDSPGEWVAGVGAPPAPPEPVQVHVAPELLEDSPSAAPKWEMQLAPARPNVRLSRGMVAALDPDSLGKLIAAGISDVDEGEMFVLEVGP